MSTPTTLAIVHEVRLLSPNVREIVLKPKDKPLHFKSGQWISLHLPIGPHPPLIRAYSLAEPEHEEGRLVLTLNVVQSSETSGSSYLFSLHEGDELTIAGPYGKFTLPEDLNTDFIFVARFTGIVPIRCMILDLLKQSFNRKILLIYGAEHPDELIYDDLFLDLVTKHSNFQYVPTLLTPSPQWSGIVGHEADSVRRLVSTSIELKPYVCGLRVLVHPVQEAMESLGFQRSEIMTERYD